MLDVLYWMHPYDSPSQPLFEKLDWLNIYERIEYSKGVLLFKSVHGLCPSYIFWIIHVSKLKRT